MKRVKIMLMAICLVAVVGGVLAFKTMTAIELCTVASANNTCPALCPNLVTTATKLTTGSFFCTAAPTTFNNQTTCTYTIDPPGPVTESTTTTPCGSSKVTISVE